MSQARAEGFKNLRLDANFFNDMLLKESDIADDADFDIYLMEKSVVPVLMQGLDALARQMEKLSTGESTLGSGKTVFNPLHWLAQFLLRNHPSHVRDHRTGMYQRFAELASIERGRRCLLRRRAQIEEHWEELETEREARLVLDDLPELVQRLDDSWGLCGEFVERMPKKYGQIRFTGDLQFIVFWDWFEELVARNDILRESAFIDAARRRAEEEEQARKAQEETARREQAAQEALEKRSVLEDQFENISGDMYINDEITSIMNKGAVLQGVEEKEHGPPLKGEHITLLVRMLELWGCPVVVQGDVVIEKDVWNDAVLATWGNWLEARGLASSDGPPRLDSVSLRRLMNKNAFEEYLQVAYPMNQNADDSDTWATVEITTFVDDDPKNLVVETVDEETGQVMQLALPEGKADGVRSRLDTGDTVLAKVDTIEGRIMEVLPPP